MELNIIILAGGKGTRIKPVLKNVPKLLAPIAGKPFLDWLLLWIDSWKLEIPKKVFLSTCIGHENIKNYCDKKNIDFICEPEIKPLGTFGALANVASKNISKNYLVLNGDTIFKADIREIYGQFINKKINNPLIILKKSQNIERFGGYKKIDKGWLFTNEKTNFISLGMFFINYKDLKERWINTTGIAFNNFSINNSNKEFMIDQSLFSRDPISARILNDNIPFIDIGIPESYTIAQKYIPEIIFS